MSNLTKNFSEKLRLEAALKNNMKDWCGLIGVSVQEKRAL